MNSENTQVKEEVKAEAPVKEEKKAEAPKTPKKEKKADASPKPKAKAPKKEKKADASPKPKAKAPKKKAPKKEKMDIISFQEFSKKFKSAKSDKEREQLFNTLLEDVGELTVDLLGEEMREEREQVLKLIEEASENPNFDKTVKLTKQAISNMKEAGLLVGTTNAEDIHRKVEGLIKKHGITFPEVDRFKSPESIGEKLVFVPLTREKMTLVVARFGRGIDKALGIEDLAKGLQQMGMESYDFLKSTWDFEKEAKGYENVKAFEKAVKKARVARMIVDAAGPENLFLPRVHKSLNGETYFGIVYPKKSNKNNLTPDRILQHGGNQATHEFNALTRAVVRIPIFGKSLIKLGVSLATPEDEQMDPVAKALFEEVSKDV